jgi:anti-sigma factor RsiW
MLGIRKLKNNKRPGAMKKMEKYRIDGAVLFRNPDGRKLPFKKLENL